MKPFIVVCLAVACAVAQEIPATQKSDDGSALLRTVIENSLKDIRALRNFVYQQSLTTQTSRLGRFHAVSQDVVETVIADGKVFARRVKHNGQVVKDAANKEDRASAPAFDALSVFGSDVPFEQLADFFRITEVEHANGKLVLTLKRNGRPGPIPALEIRMEVQPEQLRVMQARYGLEKANSEFNRVEIVCRFVTKRGYWLPAYTHYAAETHAEVHIERTNKISYKAFVVNSRIMTDFK